MLLVISMLGVLSLVFAVVLAIYFVKTYGVKMTVMWGGLLILYIVLEILMCLCILFVYEGRFEESISKEREASGQLVQSLDEIRRITVEVTEKTIRVQRTHAERISELQAWIDYLNEELEEVKQELGIEHESEPQS